MGSREKILEAVLTNQPEKMQLPDISVFKGDTGDKTRRYITTFSDVGGTALLIGDIKEIKMRVTEKYDISKRIITTIPQLSDTYEALSATVDPHTYEDVELAIIKTGLAVAENGAVWLTEENMGQRIIPYICQHLAVLVEETDIVPTMHEAYEKIGSGNYGFGGFIGGPSKTADIEQALVLGAHGPLSMTVFILVPANEII